MSYQESNAQNLKQKMIKEKTETKRYTNSKRKFRSRSLPHFPQIRKTSIKQPANAGAPKNLYINSPSTKCLNIIEQLLNYVTNSKSFTANSKGTIANYLKNLEQICKRYIKKSIKQSTASEEFWNQWYQMKDLMLSDLSEQIPKLYSRCQVFIESLRTTLQSRYESRQFEIDQQKDDEDNQQENEEINEYAELINRVNEIQETAKAAIEQIKGFKAIKEELALQSQSDKTILNIITNTIQALSKYRETDNNNSYLIPQLESYEEELQTIFTPMIQKEEVDQEIEDEPIQKSIKENQTALINPPKRRIAEPALNPEQKEEYNELFNANRELKTNLKRSLDNKRILDRKKKALDLQIKNEVEEKQKTIKNLQRKKQISETALQELKTLNEEINQQKSQLSELQSQVAPLREDLKSLNDQTMSEFEEQIQNILQENEKLKQEIKETKKNIRVKNEIVNFKYSIGQGPALLLPRLAGKIYDKSQEISLMNSSDQIFSQTPINQIDDESILQSHYQSLINDRNELIDQILNEKTKMKVQINDQEAALQHQINDLTEILNQIEEKANIDIYNKNVKESVSIIQNTQDNLSKLRQNARIELLNQQSNSEEICNNEAQSEIPVIQKEIRSLSSLNSKISQQNSEFQEKIIQPRIDLLMNRNMEKLLKIRSENTDAFDMDSEIDKINEEIESNNNRVTQILSKAEKLINELSLRMTGNENASQNDPVLILQNLATILNQIEN